MRQLNTIGFSVFVLFTALIWQSGAIAAVKDGLVQGSVHGPVHGPVQGITANQMGVASPYLRIIENNSTTEKLIRVADQRGKYGGSGRSSGGGKGIAIGVGIAVGIAAISAIQKQKEADRRKKARKRRRDQAKKARAKRKAQQAARKKKRDEQRRRAAAKRKQEQAKKRRLAQQRARKVREQKRKARLEQRRRRLEEQNQQQVADRNPTDRYPHDNNSQGVTPGGAGTTPGHETPGHETPGHVIPGHVTPGPETGGSGPRWSVGVNIPLVPLPGVDTRQPVTEPGSSQTEPPKRNAGKNPPRRQLPPQQRITPASTPVPPPVIAAVNADQYWPREVVAEIDRSQPTATDNALAQDYGIQRVSSDTNTLLGSRFVHFRIPDSRTADTVIAALLNDNRVLFAQRNNRYVVNQAYKSSAASSGLQYALTKIRLAGAHAVGQGQGVKVAVIDSGIDRNHVDLRRGIADHFDAAPKKGLVVDAHGTAIAGIIRADGLAKGVAPQADILSVRAFFKTKGQKSAQSSTVILLRAMDWVAQNGAKVVNMSFAGAKDPTLERAIDKLVERKVHLVAAGGNNGPEAPAAYPAAYDGVIAVTATDTNDKLYTKANRGKYIELAAPGVDVFVLAPKGTHSFSTGTSMAAAHVSGLIALIVQQRRNIDQQAVREILISTAIDLGKPGFDADYGAGRVDAEALVRAGIKTVAGK